MQNQNSLQIAVDPEHGNLRFVVTITFIVIVSVSFIVLNVIIPATSINLLAIIGSLVIGAAGAYFIEQQLKQRWPSGKVVELSSDSVTLLNKDKEYIRIPQSPDAHKLYWSFEISRRTRVPKGWLMVALALEYEDTYLCAYSLMSPDTFRQMPNHEHFTRLAKPTKQGESKDLRLAGEQKRLQRAESYRWHDGAEMTPEDFVIYVEKLEGLFAN